MSVGGAWHGGGESVGGRVAVELALSACVAPSWVPHPVEGLNTQPSAVNVGASASLWPSEMNHHRSLPVTAALGHLHHPLTWWYMDGMVGWMEWGGGCLALAK